MPSEPDSKESNECCYCTEQYLESSVNLHTSVVAALARSCIDRRTNFDICRDNHEASEQRAGFMITKKG
jgi:hypothetical protein